MQINDRWAVLLDARPLDLVDLKEIFGSPGTVRVVDIGLPDGATSPALVAAEFRGLSTLFEVREAADKVVCWLNGVLFVRDPNRSPIIAGSIYERTSAGYHLPPNEIRVCETFGELRARARATQDGAQPQERLWMDHVRDPKIADVLHALRGEPDWFELYRAEELMHCSKDVVPGWPESEDERFRSSATIHRHSKSSPQVRRALANLERTSQAEMTLDEARLFLARLASAWLNWKTRKDR